MRVLAINGSHRKGRNTSLMLQEVLREISRCGAETELLELAELNIRPCLGCNKCLSKPRCSIQDDDMALVAEKMLIAQGIVLGSPVYWGNVSGLMKNFMDRTRWMHMSRSLLAGKVGAAVTHAGLRNGGQELALLALEHFLRAHGLVVVNARPVTGPRFAAVAAGTLLASSTEGDPCWRKNVLEDKVAILACHQLARNMVEMIHRLGASTPPGALSCGP